MVLSGLREKNTMASPFLGLAAPNAGQGGTAALGGHTRTARRVLASHASACTGGALAQPIAGGQLSGCAAGVLPTLPAASLATWPWAQALKGSNRFCTLGSIHWEGCSRERVCILPWMDVDCVLSWRTILILRRPEGVPSACLPEDELAADWTKCRASARPHDSPAACCLTRRRKV